MDGVGGGGGRRTHRPAAAHTEQRHTRLRGPPRDFPRLAASSPALDAPSAETLRPGLAHPSTLLDIEFLCLYIDVNTYLLHGNGGWVSGVLAMDRVGSHESVAEWSVEERGKDHDAGERGASRHVIRRRRTANLGRRVWEALERKGETMFREEANSLRMAGRPAARGERMNARLGGRAS